MDAVAETMWIPAETRGEAARRRRRRRLLDRLETALIVTLALLCAAVAAGIVRQMVFLEGAHGIHRVQEAGDPIAVLSPPRFGTRTTVIGRSLEGRPIEMRSFGTGADRTLVIGGIHGSEYGADVAAAFAAYLADRPGALPNGVSVDVIPAANPDGRAAGWRGNGRHVDINRNFPSSAWRPRMWRGTNAGSRSGSEPETEALMRVLQRGYARVVSLHSSGGFVDYDPASARPLAARIAAAAGVPVRHLAPGRDYTGTLGQYVPERYGAPVITIELDSPVLTPETLAGLLDAVNARR